MTQNPSHRASSTILALNYHSERVRERAGELVPIVRHEEILGAAVENHHKSKSLLGSNLPRQLYVSEVRAQHTPVYKEVDEWADSDTEDEDDDEGDAATNTADGNGNGDLLRPPGLIPPEEAAGHNRSQQLLESLGSVQGLKRGPGAGNAGKKAAAALPSGEADPVNVLRRMRSSVAARANAATSSALEAAKRAGCAPPQLDDLDIDDEDISIHKDLNLLRGKSFLARPELQSGAADDLLAQLRGAKWQSDSVNFSRSAKSMTIKGDSSTRGGGYARSESMAKPDRISGSYGSLGSSLPGSPAGASKSFSAGKRSGALPGVSVDSRPPSALHGEQDGGGGSMRGSGRQVPANAPPHGLLSKLKNMMQK